jgi:hypothetical protein
MKGSNFMKKKQWIMSSCMGAVLALSIGAVAMAQNGVGEFCTANENFGVSHDTCVNCVTGLDEGRGDAAVCICKLEGNSGFANQGECVSYLHEEGVP